MISQRVNHNSHFFKVILESNLRNGDLRVPKSFVKKYWKGMRNPISLRLPNLTEWKVYWMKRGGDVWFLNGWKEFAEYLSLDAAQFLMFQHEGKSQFKVIVFGKSALEVKYPLSIGNDKKVDESDCSLETVVDGKRKKYSSSSQSCKKIKTNIKEEPECYDERKNDEKKASSGFDIDDMSKALLEKVKNTFRSKNHFFLCICQRTYTERDILSIPKDFLEHLRKKGGHGTLSVKERSWDVRIKFSSYKQALLCEGWRTFSQDNNLKFGDVCAFVLDKREGISFQVVIFRLGEHCSTLC
ncbi:putative transcription factor B3-Domain family [Lupinus albus]|uniref:Putative transcription factor B3-Domain family n=1 Tax=Lupinus albus TaxID=3870 RepID=A0A6A4PU70_LUPAL|nr:putative transcription factor B3-Domain family [Lupinus albus]